MNTGNLIEMNAVLTPDLNQCCDFPDDNKQLLTQIYEKMKYELVQCMYYMRALK